MKEGIGIRVARIVGGSINALIDAVEGAAPTVVLDEAIREVDEAIDQVRLEISQALARRHIANARLTEANDNHEALTEKIALAVEKKRDDLAEAAQGRQIDIEDQIPILERAIADAGEDHKELEGYLAALQAKKREMQEELRKFIESRERAVNGDSASRFPANPRRKVQNKVEKATSAFDRILEKQTGLSGSSTPTSAKDAANLAELEALTRHHRIQERLAEVKAKSQR
jgi:phage shock protein A